MIKESVVLTVEIDISIISKLSKAKVLLVTR